MLYAVFTEASYVVQKLLIKRQNRLEAVGHCIWVEPSLESQEQRLDIRLRAIAAH